MGAERRFQIVLLCFAFPFIRAGLNDGLYVSNGTDILRILNPDSASSESRSIYSQSGTIVGVAYERSSGILFWSTVDIRTRGIYRGIADSSGNIQNATKIVDYDVLEVNCLTFDWISRNLYWTDSRKKTVEVSKTDGSNRRVLLMTGMVSPRGIYADPTNGFLFWTDHGRKRIERSRLDGSDRQVIVDENVSLPNQIITSDRRLYWVDSDSKSLESSSFDGSHRTSKKLTINGQSLGSNEHVFGLAIDHTKAYVTKWNSGKLIRVDVNGDNIPSSAAGNLGDGKIFGAVFVKLLNQPTNGVAYPCQGKSCESLCLPKSTTEARCSCPSYGGKTLSGDGRTCRIPSAVLLFAVASSGYVCFRDPSVASVHSETYVVGRSPRPVAVAYDTTTQVVYWSDVRLRSVHSAKIDGTGHRILLGSRNGIGLVEGMVVDAERRQLFYTNVGSVLLETTPYTWHRVETISLDAKQVTVKVKTLVTTADRPRGLALDSARGHLYYTDWGSRASIIRVDLDGSNPTLIRTGLDNPNSIAISDRAIYFVDSHFKTRKSQANDRYPAPPKNGSLYRMTLDGTGLTDVMSSASEKFVTPFGLTTTPGGELYVSDWDRKSLSVVKGSPRGQMSAFLSDVEGIMTVHYSQYSNVAGSTGCSRMSCSDLCLARNASDVQCTCNSYGGKSANDSSCLVPRNFILVADMNSIKIVSLDERYSTPYIAVQGNPYFSNFAALTYDPATNIVYYSDVNRKSIHALYLENMTSTVFYRMNEIVDGLAINAGYLYWTDFANGRISKLQIGETTHKIFAKKLNRPRGIRIHKEYLYWTEWGNKPRVVRKLLGADINSPPQVIYSETETPKLVWPNGLHIDENSNRLYFVDGSTKTIFNCSLTGGCRPLPGAEAVVKHAYDIWFMDGSFYYSDWKSGAINAFRPDNPGAVWQVVGDLMRPSQMYIRRHPSSSSSSSSMCGSSNGGCGGGDGGGQCVPLIVNPACDCKGKAPSFDGKSCTASPGRCFHGDKTYSSGDVYVPTACVSCQCVGGGVPYALDPLYNNSLCRRIDCPTLVGCAPEDVRQPTGNDCCPTCTECGIRITNCPSSDVTLVLPSNFRFTVYDYLPAVRDCRGLSREIAFEKRPDGTIYEVGTNRVTVTAKAGSPDDSNTCAYSVIVQDKTSPIITCPSNVHRYVTNDSPVPIEWDSPQASDNVGLRSAPVPSLPWGTSLGVGAYTVTYKATDTSGLSSSCAFNVTVTKLKSKQNSCRIPSVANADLNCTDQTESLRCTVASCSPGYSLKAAVQLTCRNGTWTPNIDDDLLRDTCIKEKEQTIVGTLEIRATGVCSSDVDLQYTEKFLRYSVGKDYNRVSGIEEGVTAKCQPPPSQDLVVEVKLKGEGGAETEKSIKTKLEGIKTELDKGFLKVNYRDNDGVHSAQALVATVKTTTKQCLAGQILHDNKCKVCSPGKYQLGDGCEKCAQDHYNDEEGQTKCKPCPDARKSFPGAYIVDQCITAQEDPFPMNLVLMIGGALLALLLVVLCVVIVCCRRRRNKRQPQLPPQDQSMLHPNNAYGCYEETYDEIGDHMCNAAAAAAGGCAAEGDPAAQNHYEFLQDAGAVGGQDNYDTIAKGCCAGDDKGFGEEKEGCSLGGASNRSGASYLAPIATEPNPYTKM